MALALSVAVFAAPAAPAQTPGVLHISVTVPDAASHPVPAARHALLISDNPPTSTPRRVVTGADGTVSVRVPPGNYTVESDTPFAAAGRAYSWIETLDVAAGGTLLALTERNAEIVPLTDAMVAASAPPVVALAQRLPAWKDSIVGLWTPVRRASGFVIDARGLIVTSQRIVGDAAAVDVEVSPEVTVEGRVLAADPTRDVAVLWIDAAAVAGWAPVPLGCGQPPTPIASDQDVVALGVPLRQTQDRVIRGTLRGVAAHALDVDIRLPTGTAGGPLLTGDGRLIGITSVPDDPGARRYESRTVPIADACDVVGEAQRTMAGASPPVGTRRPTQPATPFPPAALADAVTRRGGALTPYRMTTSDFDVAFITPPMVHASQQPDRRTTSADTRAPLDRMRVPRWSDFGVWSEYVADVPPVVLVRVTPKLSEGFWTAVARGAAMTQGVNLPAIKRFSASLSRMRMFCDDTEVMPIHVFRLESQIVDKETVVEALYAFEPSAFGPHCTAVRLQVFSDKERQRGDGKSKEPHRGDGKSNDPQRGESKRVDAALVQQIWQDFEPVRRP